MVVCYVLLLVAVPTLLRVAMQPMLGATLWFPTYYPAIMIAALLLDWRAALAVLLLSALAADLLFVSFGASSGLQNAVSIGIFMLAAGLILLMATALRTALVRLEDANQRERVLNDELRHRMRNMLAVVQGLAYQTMHSGSTEPADFYANLEGRLGALGRAHGLLASGDWENYDLATLVDEALAPFNNSRRISIAGAKCTIGAASCIPLVLLLHELATNALKYGALSNGSGHVAVRWDAHDHIVLEWIERDGPPVAPPKRRGLGSRLIAKQPGLEAVDLRFEPRGVTCLIQLRAPAQERPLMAARPA